MAKKIFENHFDESIVEMSSEEKEELKRKLSDTKDNLSQKDSNSDTEDEEISESVLKEQIRELRTPSFFRMFWNFILSLIYGINFKKDANISISRIRSIKKHLNSLGISFYNFKSEALTSQFALFVLDIYKGAKICDEFFMNPKGGKSYDQYFLLFFEKILPDSSLAVLREILAENVEKIFDDENIQNKREYLKTMQKKFSDTLKAEQKQIQSFLGTIEQLINVYHGFDFINFFSEFGTMLGDKVEIQYPEIEAEKMVPFLKKLGAVAKMVTDQEIAPQIINIIQSVNESMKNKNPGDKNLLVFPVEAVNNSLKMLRKLIKFEILDSLIQYITMDESQITGYTRSKKYILNRYINHIVNDSTKAFNHMEDEKAKEYLLKNINDYFGIANERELVFPGIYTHDTKRFLKTSSDLDLLNHLRPLSILLTFLEKYYNGIIREVINTIVVKGNFVKKLQGEEFSTSYYRLDEMIDGLQNFFKEELIPNDLKKNVVIELLQNKHDFTPVEIKMLKEKFAYYDNFIISSIEKIIEELYKLYNFLEIVIQDIKRNYPEMLANIRQLPHLGNYSFISALDKTYMLLEKFFNIMRNFILIKSEISANMKKRESMGL